MKDMKAYILHLGDAGVESTYFIGDDTAATVDNPTAPHRLLHNPFTAILIDHPQAGWILFDTGIPEDWEQTWTKHMKKTIRVDRPPEKSMERQLDLVGVKPKDIKHVIISHLHMDHTGNMKLFADTADFYFAKKDHELAALNLLAWNEEQYQGNFFWVRDEVFQRLKSRTYIDRDEELFPGVEIITLPGHSPCVLGLLLHLENQPLLITSDACNCIENYNGHFPGPMFDNVSYAQSIRKIKDLEKKHGALVMFGHSTEQLNGLKKAPEFYD